jgi:hypothetical protein
MLNLCFEEQAQSTMRTCHVQRSARAPKLRGAMPHARTRAPTPQADWNIVKRGWDAHVLGKAPYKFTDPVEAIKSLRVRAAPRACAASWSPSACMWPLTAAPPPAIKRPPARASACPCLLRRARTACHRTSPHLAPPPPYQPRRQGPSDNPKSDQWLDPFVIVDEAGAPVGTVEDGDAVVLFNFRADRMVEISKAFEYADFDIFDRERYPKVRGVLLFWAAWALFMRVSSDSSSACVCVCVCVGWVGGWGVLLMAVC